METVLEDWVFWKLFAHNVFYFQKREAFPPIVVSVCLAVLNVKNTVQNDEEYFAKLDQEFFLLRNTKIDQIKFASDIWEVPSDIKYKKAIFATSMEAFKKEDREFGI